MNSGSIWKYIVVNAKDRNASEDKNLAQAAMFALVELRQFNNLFHKDSFLFNGVKWQVFWMLDTIITKNTLLWFAHFHKLFSNLVKMFSWLMLGKV